MRLASCAVLLLTLAAAGARGAPAPAGSVALALVEASDALFPGGPANAVPPEGQVLVCGRFDDPGFAIEEINQITVVAPDGRRAPLTIEGSSLFREFGRIVALRFSFLVSAAEAEGAKPFTLRWGPEVRAENALADCIVPDAARRTHYREFRPRPSGEAPAGANIGTIEVIADSSAGYHFLWYLLPMALIFALLTIRKIRARHTPDSTAA